MWAQERELAGARAATAVLEAEVARLTAAKEERKRAESVLRRKWQRITEFDARRAALEALHNDLRKENDVSLSHLTYCNPFSSQLSVESAKRGTESIERDL